MFPLAVLLFDSPLNDVFFDARSDSSGVVNVKPFDGLSQALIVSFGKVPAIVFGVYDFEELKCEKPIPCIQQVFLSGFVCPL
ncbi:MAG: hypothetical protein OEZ57_00420 [Nitrospirota bacterium]|nr:hypothetical protein [Nitrospirota bacterium]MDH5585159.1 hypothetical protein [Nitrospirota bacterium]MDH5773363.1 hypothetical protein [Nitrospirota bacterium]